MQHFRLFSLCMSCLLCCVGCESRTDMHRATVSTGGMMPVGATAPKLVYAIDQAEVKVLPARTVTYEPLDTFRAKISDEAASRPAAAAATPDAAESAPADESIWGTLSSTFGKITEAITNGGAAPAGNASAAGVSTPDGADDSAAEDEPGNDDW